MSRAEAVARWTIRNLAVWTAMFVLAVLFAFAWAGLGTVLMTVFG